MDTVPNNDMLTQTALYFVHEDVKRLKESPKSPWTKLAGARFGGDRLEKSSSISWSGNPVTGSSTDEKASLSSATISFKGPSGPSASLGMLNSDEGSMLDACEVIVSSQDGLHEGSHNVASSTAIINKDNTVQSYIDNKLVESTVISEPIVGGSSSRLHVFSNTSTDAQDNNTQGSSSALSSSGTLDINIPTWLSKAKGLDTDAAHANAGSCKAPMPSRVVQIFVKQGDVVEKGDKLVVCEAMKTEVCTVFFSKIIL